MAIPFKCPGCGFAAKVEDSMGGKKGKCPKCGEVIIVLPHPPPIVVGKCAAVQRTALKKGQPDEPSWLRKNWILLTGLLSVALFAATFLGIWLLPLLWTRWLKWVLLASLALSVTALLAVVVRGIMVRSGRLESPLAAQQYSRGLCTLIGIAILVAWITARSESLPVTAIHYAMFAAFAWAVAEMLSVVFPSPWLRKAVFGFALLGMAIWWQFDYSQHTWRKNGDEGELYDSLYVDLYRRGAELPYYRKYYRTEKDKYPNTYRSEGHLTDAGSKHGKWEWHLWDWDAQPQKSDMGFDFYWYGEKITESDWHLKNKQ